MFEWFMDRSHPLVGILIIILFVFSIAALLIGIGMFFDKKSCETKQEHSIHNSFDYEYHFPAGCLWVNKPETR
jgi:flagellar basal body-associated protein FliL